MHSYILSGTATALSSISHIGESRGIVALLRREKVLQPNGTVKDVPVISGNGIRGLLRDLGMWHMCKALGYGVNEETGEVDGLSLAAFYFLFSGGALTSDSARGLDIGTARRLRSLIPLISVFGGAVGNQIMEGKLQVGKWYPLCQETAHILPHGLVNGRGEVSIWSMLQREAYTRKDDEKNERLRLLIAPETRGLLEAKAADQRAKRGTLEEQPDSEIGQHQQMRYHVETFAAGTQFAVEFVLNDVTDVEFDAFLTCLAEFQRKPFIGGKSATGHGKVMLNLPCWLHIDPRQGLQGTEVDRPLGAHYAAHLHEHGQEMRYELAKMV